MANLEPSIRREKLLDRFINGDIDQATYDRMLQEIERIEKSVQDAPTNASSASDVPTDSQAHGNYKSVGDWPTQQAQLSESAVIGGYRLEQRIGRGGMGEVWKAFDPIGERHVVIKIVPKDVQHYDEEMQRFKQSFQRIHALQHQHICPVYVLGHDPLVGYFVVMKYIQGITLSEYWRRYVNQHGEFPLEEVVRLLTPVAQALDYAHSQGVIHRDVKPQNVIISDEGKTVHLLDFGLAAEILTSMSRISAVQMDGSGTYPYMAPEQWRGQYQDGKTDQYALAIVAYELLSGRLPFEGMTPDMLRLCVLSEEVPELSDQPSQVHGLLTTALAKSRKERFASCLKFVKSLGGNSPADLAAEIEAEYQAALENVQRTGDSDAHGIDVAEEEETSIVEDSMVIALEDADTAETLVLVDDEGKHGGIGATKDKVESVKRYRMDAEQGDAIAQHRLGDCCYFGTGVAKDWVEAVKWYSMSAKQGNPTAQCKLAYCYRHGTGAGRDEVEAVRWYRIAAEQGDAQGQYELGQYYRRGIGVVKDESESVKWYRMAAEQGDATAQLELGDCYQHGIGVVMDKTESFKWYRMAAEQGNATGQYKLAYYYERGIGVAKDEVEAVRWYRMAAEQGNAISQYKLGHCYRRGIGVVKDETEAVKWYRLVAETGSASAQHTLAHCYRNGIGVAKDEAEAAKWVRKGRRYRRT